MTRELHYFFLALMFLTRLPVPARIQYSEERFAHASRYFSLVGWVVGGASAAVFWLAHLAFPAAIALLLAMAASILLTGGFHEDGLADTCDGFGGGTTRENVLRIMKDSRIGTFGVLGLGLVLGLKYASLLALPPQLVVAALIAGHSSSRFAAASLVYTHRYVREDDPASKSSPAVRGMSLGELGACALFGLLPLALLEPGLWVAVVPPLLVRVLAGVYFGRRLGGYTGDCAGATQQLAELAFYLGLAGVLAR